MYQTKRINDDSYPALCVLYQKCFAIKQTVKLLSKKYDTSIFSLKNVGIIAEAENNEPAAYYGVFPIILTYKSKDCLVAQSGDTMTSPDHQKKGLFVKLAQETYLLAEELGIQLVYGFPNKNSFPGFKSKLNWVFNGNMQKFTLTDSGIPLCEMASKWKFLEPFYMKYVKNRISKYTIDLNQQNINCFSVKTANGFIKKDLKFFKYKLDDPTNFLIKIDDFTLLVKPKDHLIIGAVGYFEKSKMNNFTKVVKLLAKKLLCKKTIITMSQNYWLFDYLKLNYESEESLPIGFYKINNDIDVNEIEFIIADYDTF